MTCSFSPNSLTLLLVSELMPEVINKQCGVEESRLLLILAVFQSAPTGPYEHCRGHRPTDSVARPERVHILRHYGSAAFYKCWGEDYPVYSNPGEEHTLTRSSD